MSRVLIFARKFPAYHPKAGQPTLFVEKLWKSLGYDIESDELPELIWKLNPGKEHYIEDFFTTLVYGEVAPKYHTVRGLQTWYRGDKFSPRVWLGKPYRSPQLIIAPDLEVKAWWEIEVAEENDGEVKSLRVKLDHALYAIYRSNKHDWEEAFTKNDGLTIQEFIGWFGNFRGTVICWNESIAYETTPKNISREWFIQLPGMAKKNYEPLWNLYETIGFPGDRSELGMPQK